MYSVIFVVTFVLFGTNAMTTEDWKKEVSGFQHKVNDCYLQKNVSAVVGFHSEDIHALFPGKPKIVGLSGFANLVQEKLFAIKDTRAWKMNLTSYSVGIRWTCGDTAVTEFTAMKIFEDGIKTNEKGMELLRMETGTLKALSLVENYD